MPPLPDTPAGRQLLARPFAAMIFTAEGAPITLPPAASEAAAIASALQWCRDIPVPDGCEACILHNIEARIVSIVRWSHGEALATTIHHRHHPQEDSHA